MFKKIAVPVSFIFGGVSICSAQCSQQPPNGSYSVISGATVYYKVDPSVNSIAPGPGSPTVAAQIVSAFAAWNTANQQSGSGTTFVQATGGQATALTVTASQAQVTGYASTTTAYSGLISPASPATITLFPQSVLPNSATSILQASAPGYNSAYSQIMLHEVGHVMGLGDFQSPPPFSPMASVMENISGINDTGNQYQKSAPTDCDKAQAAANQKALAAAETSSNGGSGGGSAGGQDPYPGSGGSDGGGPDPTPVDGGGGGGGCGSEPGFSSQCFVSSFVNDLKTE